MTIGDIVSVECVSSFGACEIAAQPVTRMTRPNVAEWMKKEEATKMHGVTNRERGQEQVCECFSWIGFFGGGVFLLWAGQIKRKRRRFENRRRRLCWIRGSNQALGRAAALAALAAPFAASLACFDNSRRSFTIS